MQIKLWNKKWLVSDLANEEKIALRRRAVNFTVKGGSFEFEDNIFNRILLGISTQELTDLPMDEWNMDEVSAQARDYQRRDIQSMCRLRNALNRNKPGYGKTFESIDYCRVMGFKRILIVCPKSVRSQWGQQFHLWWPEVDQDVVVEGVGPKRGERSIFVTNYEQLTFRNVAGRGARKKVLQPTQTWLRCKEWSWDVIIVDESHRIKNKDAQITKAIKELPARHRMCLTGTPILSYPDDLWSQLNFLDPRLSGNNYWAFVMRFCEVEEGPFGKKILGLNPSEGAQQLLAEALSRISVGGDNHKVTQGINRIEIELDLPPEAKKLYSAVTNTALEILDEYGITVKNAMDQIIKQQQITTNIDRVLSGGVLDESVGGGWKERPQIPNVKFDWIADWLEDNEDEKVVVFSKFAETAKSLKDYLEKKKIQSELYIGAMTEKVRTASKDKFVQPRAGGARVLIGTIGAMGTGVDGLQYATKNVIFLDRDWTPGINEQAEQRVDRSGQPGMTNVWLLHAKGTIDKYVEGIQGKKAEDIRRIFEHVSNCIRSGE